MYKTRVTTLENTRLYTVSLLYRISYSYHCCDTVVFDNFIVNHVVVLFLKCFRIEGDFCTITRAVATALRLAPCPVILLFYLFVLHI